MYPINQPSMEKTEILALGDLTAAYGGQRMALDVLRRGGSTRDFMNKIISQAREESMEGASDRMLGINATDYKVGYSISAALRAGTERNWDNAGLEKNISDLITSKTGVAPHGFFVPFGALARDFNAGTANQAGNWVGSGIDATRPADPLRKLSAIGRMGATFLTGLKSTLDLPRFTSTSAAAFASEIAAAGEVLEQTSAATLTPKRIPVTMVLSRQALIQSTPALDASIGRHLTKAILEALEDGALNADGTSDSPVGLRNTSGIGSVVGGTDGALVTFAHLADLENAPALANSEETDFSGYIVNAATRRYLRTAVRASGLPFIWESSSNPLLGQRAAVTNLLPSNLVKGASGSVCSTLTYSSDWSQLVVGIYGGGIDITVDRVTLAAEGKVRIVASILAGVGLNLPAAFAAMNDAKTA